MSQYPPPPPVPPDFAMGYQQPMYPTQTSGAAIASLVLGILGCIPLLTGILAVIFGIIGIRSTTDPAVRGRGIAITGLILGTISIVCWSGLGGLMALGFHAQAPARAQSKLFLQDLSSGDLNAAMKRCATGVSRSSLQQSSDEMQAWGAYQDATFMHFHTTYNSSGQAVTEIGGTARFANTSKSVNFFLIQLPNRTFKIQEWHFQ